MDTRHIVAGLAVVLAVGVVPLGAALPAEVAPQAEAHAAAQAADASQERADAADEHADRDDATETDERENATETPENETAADAAERAGPPAEMPAQVPGHVTEIHATIAAFLQDDFDRLGPQLQDITDRGR